MRGANDGAEAILGRREHAAHQEIADLGGGDIDHPRRAGASRPASPSIGRRRRWRGRPGTRSSARNAAVICCTAGVVTPNMVRPTAGRLVAASAFAARVSSRALTIPTSALAPLPSTCARDRVQSLHVGDRIHHGDVGMTDIARDIAGGDRRDDQLGHPDRQRAHRRAPPARPRQSHQPRSCRRRPTAVAASWRRPPPSPSPRRRDRSRTRRCHRADG